MFAPDVLLCSLLGSALASLPSLLVLCRVRRLETHNFYDHQTGLRNGRLFDDDFALLGRATQAVAVLLIDLDNFGRFNEAGYRDEGDRALLRAAQVIKENLLRSSDRVYRMYTAGDEFLVLMTPGSHREAFRSAERVRIALERAAVPASIGLAYSPGLSRYTTRRADDMLRRSTEAKKSAKRSGGNCVYPTDDPSPPPIPIATARSALHVLPCVADTEPRLKTVSHG